jgi:hypothetical protein
VACNVMLPVRAQRSGNVQTVVAVSLGQVYWYYSSSRGEMYHDYDSCLMAAAYHFSFHPKG